MYASNHREYYRKLGELADLPDDEADLFAKLLVRWKRKNRKRSVRRLSLRDLKYNGKVYFFLDNLLKMLV